MKSLNELSKKKGSFFHFRSKDAKKKELMSDADILESSARLYSSYTMILLIIVIFLGLLFWASVTEIEEIAHTNGEIVPATKIFSIQHSRGGVVQKVFVQNGQLVNKGQALLKLDPLSVQTELEKMILEVIALTANKIRIQGNFDNKSYSKKELLERLKKEVNFQKKHKKLVNEMFQNSALLFFLGNKKDTTETEDISLQVKKKEFQLDLLLQKAQMQKEMRTVMQEELDMYEKLKEKNLASSREILAVRRQYIKLRSDEVETQKDIEKQRKTLEEFKTKKQQAKSIGSLEMAAKLSKIKNQIVQANLNIKKLEDQNADLVVRTSVGGIVKGLSVTQGGVVSPKETLMDVVPINTRLVIETKIARRDVGYIKVGDLVKIKVLNYDFTKYGVLNGTVKQIFATTYFDKNTNKVYYKGVISLPKDFLGSNPGRSRLLPGMLVKADIYLGKTTVMEYLLKPKD